MSDRLDCFGTYYSQDPLCRKHCALRLRCVIERDRENRFGQIEDVEFPYVGLEME